MSSSDRHREAVERKPPIEPGSALYEAMRERNLIYHGDRPGGFIEGWEAHEARQQVLGEERIGRRNFNAECPERPGVSVGEDLVDKWAAQGIKIETLERRLSRQGEQDRVRATLERIKARAALWKSDSRSMLRLNARLAYEEADATLSERVTHGRHCTCSACAQEDWTNPDYVCGMHGPSCPHVYAPLGPAGSVEPEDTGEEKRDG